ncbi:MAG: hypothetical protein Cons2KO_27840 [Congregibacter sp.]
MNASFDVSVNAVATAAALDGFIFSALLSAMFAAVCIAYLVAMWPVTGRLTKRVGWMIHTLFLLWQSNVAFVAVVALNAAKTNQEMAGDMLLAWGKAPFIVPSAAILYTCTAILCVATLYSRGLEVSRQHNSSAAGELP